MIVHGKTSYSLFYLSPRSTVRIVLNVNEFYATFAWKTGGVVWLTLFNHRDVNSINERYLNPAAREIISSLISPKTF